MAVKVKKLVKAIPKFNNPLLIEGLPGIGNVGKVAADFMVEELKAKKFLEIRSFSFPHSVFVNEQNLVDLPLVHMYYKKSNGNGRAKGKAKKKNAAKGGNRDLLFLVGDIQPLDEVASYEFSYKVLSILKYVGCREIITMGGIGLQTVPEKPKVYCTGSSKEIVAKYIKGTNASGNLYGIVGPIIGVTGLLVGLAKEKDMDAVCMLAETYGHPLYLGLDGSQEILKILNNKLGLGMDLREFGKEMEEVEKELMKRTKELTKAAKAAKLSRLKNDEVSYIG